MPVPNPQDFFGNNVGVLGGFKDIQDWQSAVTKYENPTTAQDVLTYLGDNQSNDESLKDLYWDYLLSEKSANDAYQRELLADSSKYQRLVADLKKAGLNPMFALGGASSGNISSQSNSYSSAQETRRFHRASETLSYEQLKEQKRKNNMDFIANILKVVVSAATLAIV